MHLSIPVGPASGRTVLSIEDGVIGYGKPLCEGLSVLVERGQKIAVIGANGIGKSTLLKTIAQKINPLAGAFKLGHNVALSWFAQDQLETLELDKSVLDNVLASSSAVTNQIARSILGALLFSGDDVNKLVKVLSGGEKARVGLARLLANQANFLILDEPTNHLDISSCEILSQAIRDYEGTVMFVSHDREFIDGVCTHVFAMLPDGRARLFEGSLEDYRRQAKLSGFPDVLDPVTGSQPAAAASNKNATYGTSSSSRDLNESDVASLRRDLQRLQKKIDQLDRDIEKATLEIQGLDQTLAECGGDFQKAGEISSIKQDAESRLAASEQEWLEISETAEKIRTTLKENGRSV
jgi:ATP-binding cassette subfamily F protein 3